MTRQTAFVFPGQGAQQVGMGMALCEASPAAQAVFDEASRVLGDAFVRLIRNGEPEALNLTENTQPAILTASICAWQALRERIDIEPDATAGHSLGEYSALVCAGSLSFEDALRAVKERGRAMQSAVPEGEGAMAAVGGLQPGAVASVLEIVRREGEVLTVSGLNNPQQTTISGSAEAVERAIEALQEAGAVRVKKLPVSAPFHSPLMAPVEVLLREVLANAEPQRPSVDVYSNVEAAPYPGAERVSPLLLQQLTRPVRWVETIVAMRSRGIDTFVELGPGHALTGMIKKIDRSAKTARVSDPETLGKAVELLSDRS